MNRDEVVILTTLCLLALAVGLVFAPSRNGSPVTTVAQYSTRTSFATATVTATVTVTESITSSKQSMVTFAYTAPYALLGPPVGPLSGSLPPNQTGCVYLYGSDHNTYGLYNLPAVYPTGQVTVYGQYLTWEPSPQDSCSGIRIYVTSISQQ
jgi:hypothetical protein